MHVKLQLVDPKVNSRKFWRGEIKGGLGEWTLVVAYGRLGAKGVTTIETYPTFGSANIRLRDRVEDKVRKGYKVVENKLSDAPFEVAAAPQAAAPRAEIRPVARPVRQISFAEGF